MQLSRVAVLIVFVCTGCGQSSSGSGQSQTNSEPYVHRATGFTFPSAVGEFTRAQVTEYNSEGTDIGVGYNLYTPSKQIAVTVFVYPAPEAAAKEAQEKACAEQFGSMKADIKTHHRAVREIEETTIPSPSADYGTVGRKAVYSFDDVFAGTDQPLRSEADLYCYVGGPWFVAYRTTTPSGTDYEPALRRWPASGKLASSR